MRSPLLALGVAAAIAAASPPRASADTHTFDIAGIGTFTDDFELAFSTLFHDFGEPGTVTLIEFDVNYESFDPSWGSEVIISIDTDLSFVDILMVSLGATDDPGSFAFSGSDLGDLESSDGFVYLTLWESFYDGVDPDALFGPGSTVTVHFTRGVVPEPSAFVLASTGLAGGLILARKRRRTGVA